MHSVQKFHRQSVQEFHRKYGLIPADVFPKILLHVLYDVKQYCYGKSYLAGLIYIVFKDARKITDEHCIYSVKFAIRFKDSKDKFLILQCFTTYLRASKA